VLFKVGNGKDYFKDLNWASALASDVYDWAKASDVKFENNHLLFVGKANETIKDVDLSALSIDIPDLTIDLTDRGEYPEGDENNDYQVKVVTYLDNNGYEITGIRAFMPTKNYVDRTVAAAIGAANAAVTYLGVLVEPASPADTPEGIYS
jgi:hypothetical protein